MVERLKEKIRDIPDFPKKGIIFKDLTTLLKDPWAFNRSIDSMAERYFGKGIEVVVGIESRGFIIGSALAYRLAAGFVPVRKLGKLPGETYSVIYELEYGTDQLEIHKDAVNRGQNVVIVDDLLATGGTMKATIELVHNMGANIVGLAFAVELTFLKGREKLKGYDIFSLIQY